MKADQILLSVNTMGNEGETIARNNIESEFGFVWPPYVSLEQTVGQKASYIERLKKLLHGSTVYVYRAAHSGIESNEENPCDWHAP